MDIITTGQAKSRRLTRNVGHTEGTKPCCLSFCKADSPLRHRVRIVASLLALWYGYALCQLYAPHFGKGWRSLATYLGHFSSCVRQDKAGFWVKGSTHDEASARTQPTMGTSPILSLRLGFRYQIPAPSISYGSGKYLCIIRA